MNTTPILSKTENPVTFILCRRERGKLYGLAGTHSGSCLAGAELLFSAAGFSTVKSLFVKSAVEVHWQNVERQKNYKGRAADFRFVEGTEDDENREWHRQTWPRYKDRGHTPDTYIGQYPSADKCREVLA